ncbi:Acyl-coenzyme A oxidase [Streptomyces sp. TLI_053]|uniref:acyl-CoA dehydrogenase family protein n=1 Tax=Streptomyces sp. TLI_053 TaxID=1855352 RepID=UPI00087B688B|nr:acyl-CoA dehydrogenase [Streptomyces sp. TLI_053]SDT38664.1 Acyl-coenzyme A oxidase [Streptomyces sp. TLI_053]
MTTIPHRRNPDESAIPPGPAGPGAVTAGLTRLLFGPGDTHGHRSWRALAADPAMHRRTDAPAAEQVADSYRRLRRLNERVDATALATDPARLAALHEWTGPADGALTVIAGIHYNLFLGSLLDHDPDPKRPLDEYLRMDRIGTFLCTELAHGNDAAALETVADYDRADRTFTLHTPHPGARKFMPNTGPAGGPKSAVVAARLRVDGRDHGIFLFHTPLTDEAGPLPGVTVRALPLRPGSPVDHCLTSFDRVRLPREALLTGAHGRLADDGALTSVLGSRRKRFLAAIGRVSVGKLCMSASAVGGARAALATAVRYAHHREIADTRPDRRRPVWTHRTHHGPLLSGLATVYAMTALHRAAVARWTGHDPADPADRAAAERAAAVTKGWTTWQARGLIIEARERCGAQGLLPVNGLTALASDVEGAITAEGDNLALWAKAGAELLLEAPDDGSEDPAVTPGGPVALGDPVFRQARLRAVGRLRLARARTRMREAPAGDTLRRWNAAAPDALAAVTARAEHDAGAALLAWADAACVDGAWADDASADGAGAGPAGRAGAAAAGSGPAVRALLLDLHRLFTLDRIAAHAAALMVAGELTAEQAAALPDLRERSFARLAGHALPLVDAFDLPPTLLGNRPIATPEYQEAFAV